MNRRYLVSDSCSARLAPLASRCSDRLIIRLIAAVVILFLAVTLYLNATSPFNYELIVTLERVKNRRLMSSLCSMLGSHCLKGSWEHTTAATTSTEPVNPTWDVNRYANRFFWETVHGSEGFVTFKGGKGRELAFRKSPVYVPSKCSTSVAQRMSHNRRGPTIFHPELHLLMNSELLNKSEYLRLAPFYMPFGYKNKRKFSFKDVLATLKLFPAKSSIFEFSKDKPRPECLSCAVVCNGGVLNGSKKGEEIDNHHMVFRVNKAVRRHHEKDVGQRATHYFFFDRSLRNTSVVDVPADKGLIYVFVPCRDNDYKYITSVVRGLEPKIKVATQDIRILHPDFIRYIMKIWVHSPLKSFRPTTGTLMLMTALHSGCDQVSVYGMGYTDKYTLYYYDSAYRRFHMDKSSHDTQSELAILKGLDRAGIITWYKRDVEEFHTS
ncbi:alpha-N-acetylgalactosaminide alpha-2,6-sialyltransferase 2-like isoform X2 [Acanthaster planci]|uniref:alpha-N-acetylgalactosaminide alpha-2,6-sialyltransferase n=1 Tax=Acanthaster planci TaxID=133434 RepID=A0A8B7XQX1_ACAPL|nr:alpha-N-acetylgalactosaminide alpha-2,6-sialyltransferase 2-like isoform X1 [Acanthaster planci]XP_022083239.1 alpha-N-acetylgalactosaminide alpha-2,6-sialyltransferase 2-like isoform X2 [Acanthaster planci]